MDGKALTGHFPAPFFDKEGVLWTYDPDFGWQNDVQWKEKYQRSFLQSASGAVGRVMVFGTAGDLEDKGDFKNMFYNPQEWKLLP